MPTAQRQLSILDAIARSESVPQQNRYRPPMFVDIPLLVVMVLLVSFGLLMLYSTSGVLAQDKFGDALFYLKRQGAAVAIGLLVGFGITRVRLSQFQKASPYFLLVSIGLLLLPLIPGIQQSAGGAARWVNIGGFRFQPGEMVKVLFIIFMAGYFDRRQHQLHRFLHGILKPLILVGSVGLLFLLQPDFGSTALVLIVTLTMALASGVRLTHVAISGVLCALGMLGLIMTSPYRMKRLLSFLEPTADASGKGYQLIQSLVAVGSGELTGVGLGASQQKLFFLPAAHTDFIFAVIGEETGFLGSVAIVLLFSVILWRGLRIANRIPRPHFGFALAVGMTMLLVVPGLLNMGVVLGLLPTKGLALPFVSYGGTNIVMNCITVGILLALARDSVENFSHGR